MVDAELVQDCSPKVVYRRLLLDSMTTEVVGGTVRDSTLYTGAGKPDGEAVRVVIAAVATLCVWCATEFASPNDKCFVK